MKSAFFLLPFFLYLGVAAQSAGLYVFGCVLLFIAIGRSVKTGQISAVHARKVLHELKILGATLVCMWLVFPLLNFLGSLGSVPVTIRPFVSAFPPDLKLGASHLPSTVLVAGILMILGSFWLKRWLARYTECRRQAGCVYKTGSSLLYLARGSFVGAALVFPYFLLQTVTGFDYRAPDLYLDSGQLMPSGFFRLYGLYGHPLSMASVALAQCAFHGFLALALLSQRDKSALSVRVDQTFATEPRSQGEESLTCAEEGAAKGLMGRFWCSSAALSFSSFLLNAFFLFQSGGRTATLVMITMMPVAAVFVFGRRVLSPRFLAGAGGVALVLGAALYSSGLVGRAFQFVQSLGQASGHSESARFAFWRVHWQMFLDSPWFGIGHAQTQSTTLRDAYFQALGLEDMERKMNAHQFFIQTLADVGVFGFVVLGGLVLFLLLRLRKMLQTHPAHHIQTFRGQPLIWLALSLAILANALHGLSQNTFYDASVMVIYLGWVCLFLHAMVWPRRNGADVEWKTASNQAGSSPHAWS